MSGCVINSAPHALHLENKPWRKTERKT